LGTIDPIRLKTLESRLGAKVPQDFTQSLAEREPVREGNLALVTPDGVWDVRTTFVMDGEDDSDQLDRVYNLVGDVLPSGALPFAEDWGGNFYCLMLAGPLAGQVVYWDHERDDDDNSVVRLTGSLEEFYSRLVPDPREADA
jgi:hypothetical protein